MTARTPEPERVAERAYSIWEEEGCPHGHDHAHWHRAERELGGRGSAASNDEAAMPSAPAAKRPARARKAAAPGAAAAAPAPKRGRAKAATS